MQPFRRQDPGMTGGKLKKAAHGGGAKQYGENTRKSVIDFSASLNPLPPQVDWAPDPDVLSCYPDDGYSRLKSVIGRISGRPEEEICVGNGSIELLRVFCAAGLGPGSSYVTEDPTFGEYALSAEITGARRANPGESPRVSFVCNPNNPTGALRTRSAMQALLKESEEQGTFLFLDEAFIELADTPESISDIRSGNLFVLRSLTKCFSVPGIRFGYGFGDPDLIETIELMRSPWSVNAFAESFAIAALQKFGELESSRQYIRRERDRLVAGLTDLGFSVTPSYTNFVLAATSRNAADLRERLLARGIMVRDCASFGLPESIRIAVLTREENTQLLEALSECLR